MRFIPNAKSFVSRRQSEEPAVARQAEGNNDKNDLKLELRYLFKGFYIL